MARPPLLPLLSAACGIATFSIMDALMKRASLAGGVYTALLWRCAIGAALGAVLWQISVWRGGPGPDRGRMLLHAARSAVTCGMALAFFWGLMRTPMAVGMALSFIAPIIALFFAALILGEAITRRALIASALGLLGVVVIGVGRMRDGGLASPDSLWGIAAILGSAVLYATNLVMQRHQAQMASPAEIAFFQSLFMGCFLVLAGAIYAPLRHALIPPASAWPDIAGAAALATVSLMLLSWGWARAPAHRLLPIEYSAFLWAALMGWLWFDEVVAISTLLGAVLIVAGCWYGSAGRRDEPAHMEQTAL